MEAALNGWVAMTQGELRWLGVQPSGRAPQFADVSFVHV